MTIIDIIFKYHDSTAIKSVDTINCYHGCDITTGLGFFHQKWQLKYSHHCNGGVLRRRVFNPTQTSFWHFQSLLSDKCGRYNCYCQMSLFKIVKLESNLNEPHLWKHCICDPRVCIIWYLEDELCRVNLSKTTVTCP